MASTPSYQLPPLLTDTLDAVNSMLQSIGEAPVSSVEVSEAVDVAACLGALKEVQNAVLSKGWHWNREYGLTLVPATDGTIPLPDNCLYIGATYWLTDYPGNGTVGPYVDSDVRRANITERARKLYDQNNHTFQFVEDVVVDMILALAFEEMPEYARRYVTIRACQLFQGRIQSSQIVFKVQDSEVTSALAVLEQREDEANPLNVVTGNRSITPRLFGRLLRRRRS